MSKSQINELSSLKKSECVTIFVFINYTTFYTNLGSMNSKKEVCLN